MQTHDPLAPCRNHRIMFRSRIHVKFADPAYSVEEPEFGPIPLTHQVQLGCASGDPFKVGEESLDDNCGVKDSIPASITDRVS